MTMFNYYWPGQVHLGPGAAALVGQIAVEQGAGALFIVADPGILDLLEPVTQALAAVDLPATIFSDVIGNPDVIHVDLAAEAYRASGADAIIGFGGGSALDTAKGVRLLAGAPSGVSSAAYMSTAVEKLPLPSIRALPPLIAIPTTAGTGSEVTPWGVVTDHANRQKSGLGGTRLRPDAALVDPTLTIGLPPFLTAATGMDTLSHLIEAYVSTNRHPALDPLILRGIKLVGENLARATTRPDDLTARQNMMEAALLGGIAISSNWVGACHSLAHQLSTFADLHHGLACAVMLPPQMRHALAASPGRYADVQQALNLPGQDAAEAVHNLNLEIGLPTRLSMIGVDQGTIPTMAKHALIDPNWTTNPLPLDEKGMADLYLQVW